MRELPRHLILNDFYLWFNIKEKEEYYSTPLYLYGVTRTEHKEDDIYRYEVELQESKFVTYLSEEDLKKSAGLAIYLIEEMKDINNNGMDEQRFKEIVSAMEEKYDSKFVRKISVFNELCGCNMAKLILDISDSKRVGGVYVLLIAHPLLKSAIYAVYEKLVDHFDDEDLYVFAAYFLTRVILKMHSEEMEEN